MKMKNIVLILTGIILLSLSCRKAVENVIDCLFEGGYITIEHSANAGNSKIITFTLTYDGEYSLENTVTWNFGDGSPEVTGNKTITKTYENAGTYDVQAHWKVTHKHESCSSTKSKKITVD